MAAFSDLITLFTGLANKIRDKLGNHNTYTPAQAISAIDDVYTKGVTDTKVGTAGVGDVVSGKTFTNASGVGLTGTFASQTKTQAPSTSAIDVTPDSGKWLSKVTVSAIQTETKTQAPSTSAIDVTPTSGKFLTKVTVSAIPTETKSASPSTSAQTITPTSGKFLTSVSISAISPQRAAGTAAVASGKDSTGPYVYFPYGWYPSGGNDRQYVRMTAAQAVAACPSQSKSTTSSRTAQTISPDSGNLLSSVSIAKYPDASGTFTPNSSQYNTTAADMGATNNLRYVNTSVCYSEGQKNVYTSQRQLRIQGSGGVLTRIRLSGFCSKIKFQGFWYDGDAQLSTDTIDFIGSSGGVIMSKPISYFNTEWKSLDIGQIVYYMQIHLPQDSDNYRVVQTDYIEYN